jgi:hypothetical protein
MSEGKQRLTVGLFRKSEENKMEDYIHAIPDLPPNLPPGIKATELGRDFEELVQLKLQQMRENPEQFFNFGFTYNDFKSYLFKLTYCRAVRRFIEKKRLERIAEFQENNNFTLGMEMDENK